MKKFFNMIEITLAIAVVGIGMTGVMSLFPVGLQATRDAIGDNYASYSADALISYLTQQSQANWTTVIGTSDTTGIIRATPPTISETPDSASNWTLPDETALNGKSICTSSKWGTPAAIDLDVLKIYGLFQGTANGSVVEVADFAAHARVWKSQVSGVWTFSSNAAPISYDKAVKLNIEISWPVEKPYSKREKRYYSIELFREL